MLGWLDRDHKVGLEQVLPDRNDLLFFASKHFMLTLLNYCNKYIRAISLFTCLGKMNDDLCTTKRKRLVVWQFWQCPELGVNCMSLKCALLMRFSSWHNWAGRKPCVYWWGQVWCHKLPLWAALCTMFWFLDSLPFELSPEFWENDVTWQCADFSVETASLWCCFVSQASK